MTTGIYHSDWPTTLIALKALSDEERASLLAGISLEEYEKRNSRFPTAQRPRFVDEHALLAAPHALAIALQLLRDDGQLDSVVHLACDKDEADKRGWSYRHQATLTSLEPLAGLTGLKCLLADIHQTPDISPLGRCPNLTHLYLYSARNQTPSTIPSVDLSPLANLEFLELLSFGDARRSRTVQPLSLEPLQGLKTLRVLTINDASLIRDLSPLSDLGSLEILQLMKALRLSDVGPVVSILKGVQQDSVRVIETALSIEQVEEMATHWNQTFNDAEVEQLVALRTAIRAGDPIALENALVGVSDGVLELVLSGTNISETSQNYQSWADLKRASLRRTELCMRLAKAQGTLSDWTHLALPTRGTFDHALTDDATGLVSLTLAARSELKGDTLKEWLAVPAELRTALQNLDVEGVNRGVKMLADHELSPEVEALLLSRMPEFIRLKHAYCFDGLDLREQTLRGQRVCAQLPNTDLRNMDLSRAHFNGVDLRGARLDNANLTGARFSRCQLDGAQLDGAIIEKVVIDSRTQWPEGLPQPVTLPVAEVIEAEDALEKAASNLMDAINEMSVVPDHIQALLGSLPTLGLSWSSASRLQQTLDSKAMDRVMKRLSILFDIAGELEVQGCFDDETGYDPDVLTLGPVSFNETGAYIYDSGRLVEVFTEMADDDDRARFHDFISQFASSEYDWDNSQVSAFFDSPEELDRAGMIAAIQSIGDQFSYVSEDECVGIDSDLATFFDIVLRMYSRCASMREENETLPIDWVKYRIQ